MGRNATRDEGAKAFGHEGDRSSRSFPGVRFVTSGLVDRADRIYFFWAASCSSERAALRMCGIA